MAFRVSACFLSLRVSDRAPPRRRAPGTDPFLAGEIISRPRGAVNPAFPARPRRGIRLQLHRRGSRYHCARIPHKAGGEVDTRTLTGAESFLRLLAAMGVDRIFASPGSEWAPVWEHLAKPYASDGSIPAYFSARHEEI